MCSNVRRSIPCAALLLFLLGTGAFAQPARIQILVLDQPRRFHLGDDPCWKDPAFDDSSWQTLFERTREISTRSAREIAEAAQAWGQNDDITTVTFRRSA